MTTRFKAITLTKNSRLQLPKYKYK